VTSSCSGTARADRRPPGLRKTLIANSLAAKNVAAVKRDRRPKSCAVNIKGSGALNEYVGESERHIRLVFQRAREKASEGAPVIVFFYEMDSIFRTHGSGVSSDVESTIVPQLLSEIDGVEELENVIVIGASNREDMIDPASCGRGGSRSRSRSRGRTPRRRGTSSAGI
jgi:proteasome-associated ATPase